MHRIRFFLLPGALFTLLAACSQSTEAVATKPAETPPAIPEADGCGAHGTLTVELHGAIETRIAWDADAVACDSMLRPDGAGARLRYAGTDRGERLALLLSLPGLQRGATGDALPTTLTLTVEGSGRFFSSADLDTCWSDIERNEALDEDDGRYGLAGEVYCVAPLGEMNGDAGISVQGLEFTALVDWTTP